MNLRKRILQPGWYPNSGEKVQHFLESFSWKDDRKGAVAALAPHAGWVYSGHIAARAVSALAPEADTVVVIGGHLPAATPPLFAEEDGVVTPLGNMEIDREFRDILWKELGGKPDRYYDNTVEVLLPMVKSYFPQARLIWLRLAAEIQSYYVGKTVAKIGSSLERNLVLLGSTDLTHYGLNYDFAPHGLGRPALEWMKNINDAAFIRAVMSGDGGETLRRAELDKSSCSVGAVLACLGYAQSLPAGDAALLSYGTSADTPPAAFDGASSRAALGGGSSDGLSSDDSPSDEPFSGPDEIPESFVGYAAMAWYPAQGGSAASSSFRQ